MLQLALTGSTAKGNDLGGTRLGVVYPALNRTARRENPEGGRGQYTLYVLNTQKVSSGQ
jgi:hypothetical protein